MAIKTIVGLVITVILIYGCAISIVEKFYLRTFSSCFLNGSLAYIYANPLPSSYLYLLNLSDGFEVNTGCEAVDLCWFYNSEEILIEDALYSFSIYSISSGSQTPLDNLRGTTPSIHPSDELIAYQGNSEHLVIYSIPEEEEIYISPFFCLHPDWDPSGNEIIFVNESLGLSIYNFNEDSTQQLNVDTDLNYPVWSPDGKMIAFTRPFYSDVYEGDLYVYYLDSGVEEKLVEGAYPEWTVDSSSLIFSKSGPTSNGRIDSHLYCYDLDSGETSQLTH